MNNARRKAINAQYYRLKEVLYAISPLVSTLDEIRSEIEELRDQEQEAFDNMPEGLQSSERGQALEQAFENLSLVADTIGAWDFQDILDTGEEALEALDNAEHNT